MRQIIAAALFVLGAGAAAWAAEPAGDTPPNPFGLPGEWREVLKQDAVRKELKLTPKQAERLAPVLDDASLPIDESRKRIDEALDADQTARLKQASLRISGPFAAFEPEVAHALALTPDQGSKLAEIARKQHAEMKDFLSRARFRSREAMQKYMDECRDGAGEKLKAVFTPAQQKRLAELQGKSAASQ